VICAFGKGHIPADGRLRGWRTTLLTDSDLGPRPARAVLGSVIASVIGDPAVYVSAGIGFHEGPPGGGSIAVIARMPEP
jgi:cyanuric acid amidohydrolase